MKHSLTSRLALPLLAFLTSTIGIDTVIADATRPAPSCVLPSIDGTTQIDPAARPGKLVYLDFWASWCGPCAKSFPFLDQLEQELGPQGFEVIAINLDETREDAATFLAKHPVSFTIAMDPKGECPRRYAVKGMPTSFLIDPKGQIRSIHEGFSDGDTTKIRAEIERLLPAP